MSALPPLESQRDLRPPAETAPPCHPPGATHGAIDSLVLDPLDDLLDAPPPPVVELETAETPRMPEPYRRLLVHRRDMTSTLERHHGEPSVLEVLERRQVAGALLRKVLLRGARSGRVQEMGAIRIELERFAPDARRVILEGHRPLGAILADFAVRYTSRPQRFFAIDATGELRRRLGSPADGRLYGRRNLLVGTEGTLAEVVEILPPAD